VKIYKYELKIEDYQVLQMPKGARVLSVGNQRGKLCLWAVCDQDAPASLRAFEIFGTGNPISEDRTIERTFIGTAIVEPFVWHVFETAKKRPVKTC
jgi:hypothetical protein